MSMKLEVLTPERQALDLRIDAVYLQGSLGRLGILSQHVALISKLDFGTLDHSGASGAGQLLCGDGLVEVHDNMVTVLVRSAESRDGIDIDRAKGALDRARQRRDSKDNDVDMARAEAALARALTRLQFAGEM